MLFRTSDGRHYSSAARDVLLVSRKVRAWRIAGWRIAQADELLSELDELASKYPRHIRRLACLRTVLMASVMDSVIGIPEGVAW